MKKLVLMLVSIMLLLGGCARKEVPGGPNTDQWQSTKDLYRVVVTYSGENDSDEKYLEIAQRSEALLKRLTAEKGAFVIDAYNYEIDPEENKYIYELNHKLNGIPSEISPSGYCIFISENYLLHNPIMLTNGASLAEKISYETNTLNILVPEQYKDREIEIVNEYRKHFYYEKIEVENIFNEGLGRQLDQTTEDMLQINLIYVQDGQTYFTYNEKSAPDTGNLITDPIAVIYTFNTHISYAHSYMSRCVYFPCEAKDTDTAFTDIQPIVAECMAEDSYKKVYSVYDENRK